MSIEEIFKKRKKLERELTALQLEQINIELEIKHIDKNDFFDPFSILKKNNDIAVKNKNYRLKSEKIEEIKAEIQKIPQKVCSEISKSILNYHDNLKIENERMRKIQIYKKIFYLSTFVASSYIFVKTLRRIQK